MRKGFLALLGVLAVGAAVCLAQADPAAPGVPTPKRADETPASDQPPPGVAAPAVEPSVLPAGSTDDPQMSAAPAPAADPLAPTVPAPTADPKSSAAPTPVADPPSLDIPAPETEQPPSAEPAPAEKILTAPIPDPAVPMPAMPAPLAGVDPAVNGPIQLTQSFDPGDRFWFDTDYLLWWTKRQAVPSPLVTTGPANNPKGLGLFGQSDTTVLFGDHSQNYDTLNGLHFDAGMWLDREHRWGVEGSYFVLERGASSFAANSNANGNFGPGGNNVLAQPLVNAQNGQEFTEVISAPGAFTGGVTGSTHSRLQGWELNALANAYRSTGFSIDLILGFRALDLDEDLQLSTTFTSISPNLPLTFQGQPVAEGDSESTFDRFGTQNHFYGPQFGGKMEWTSDRFSFSLMGKLAMGVSQEVVQADGTSSLIAPGSTMTVPGGVLVQSTNSGRSYHEDFAVVPEVGITVGYQFNDHLEAHVGYSFLYWDEVVRPGNQIDRVVDPALIPTDPGFGNSTTNRPAVQFNRTDYWAHGFDLGLGFRY